MDQEAIAKSNDIPALQARHRELLQMVEAYRNSDKTELTEREAVAEKHLIEARLAEFGAPTSPDVRMSTEASRRMAQKIEMGGKE